MDDLISDLEVVLHDDPALDLSVMDMKKYLEERDRSLVVELPGRKARWFTLRALDIVEAAGVSGQPSVANKVLLAVRVGLVAITHEGIRNGPKRETEDMFGKLRATYSLEEVNLLFGNRRGSFGWNALVELGMVILERLEKGNVDGGGVRFTLPPQSQAVLERNALQRAEQIRTAAATQT